MTPQHDVEADATGIASLSAFTREQLEAEDRRKTSLEQRGLAVITTAGALVTLLFGLAALSTKAQSTFVLEPAAKLLLVAALVLFVAAAGAALLTNLPANYALANLDGVRDALKGDRPPTAADAERKAALTRISVARQARAKNQVKGMALIVAIGFEVVAVALVGTAVALVIL